MPDKYIEPARRANRHPVKLTVLSELLKEIFNVKLERFLTSRMNEWLFFSNYVRVTVVFILLMRK